MTHATHINSDLKRTEDTQTASLTIYNHSRITVRGQSDVLLKHVIYICGPLQMYTNTLVHAVYSVQWFVCCMALIVCSDVCLKG